MATHDDVTAAIREAEEVFEVETYLEGENNDETGLTVRVDDPMHIHELEDLLRANTIEFTTNSVQAAFTIKQTDPDEPVHHHD